MTDRTHRLRSAALLVVLAPLVLAGKCGGGDGSSGSPPVVDQTSSDVRCAPLGEIGGFPPGYDFIPGAGAASPTRLLAGTATGSVLIPFGIDAVPFQIPAGLATYPLPGDSDGDGIPEFFKSIAAIDGVASDLALVTVSGNIDGVLFVDPGGVGPRSVRVDVPAAFDPADFAPFPGLPAPGTSRLQTGITASACIDAGAGARDSRGDLLVDAIPMAAWCNGPGSFPASFASASAQVGDRLFVATSNLGARQGMPDTQFLPGAVVAYDFDASGDPLVVGPTLSTPDGRPYIVTSAFNPSGLTPFTTASGRALLLVTQTGAIGIEQDDPNTDEMESGTLPITDGAIDVIDVAALELVATIPLADANPSLGPLGIDPSGRVAAFGDVAGRSVYAVDLAALDALPPAGSGAPVVLDAAVIFDGTNPLVVPGRMPRAASASCGGRMEGAAFNAMGDRLYALETCDGTVGAWDVDLSGDPSLAELRTRFTFAVLSVATAALRVDTLGQLRQPASLAVRPGTPGVDYAGPDVFFTIGDPEGLVCGVRIDAP